MMTIHGLNYLLAQQTQLAPNPTGSEIKVFAPLVLFMIIMWVLMIAPQRKKQKELDATLKSLKAGDKIVTTSGIIAVILSVKDKSLSIRSADTKLEVLKSAVAEVSERGGDVAELKS